MPFAFFNLKIMKQFALYNNGEMIQYQKSCTFSRLFASQSEEVFKR